MTEPAAPVSEEETKKKKKIEDGTTATKRDFNENFIVAYTVIMLFVFPIIATYTYFYGNTPIIKILFYVACSGAIGGLVYSILGFVSHHESGDFDVQKYFWWYIYRPVTAMILGVFSFFFVAGGLMTLSGLQDSAIPSGPFALKSIMFYCALAFLVGYANNPFLRKIYDLANVLFGESTASKDKSSSAGSSTDTKDGKTKDAKDTKGKHADTLKDTL